MVQEQILQGRVSILLYHIIIATIISSVNHIEKGAGQRVTQVALSGEVADKTRIVLKLSSLQ